MDFTGAVLAKADLTGARFHDANLFRVDFAKSHGDTKTNLKDANVKRVRTVRARKPRRAPGRSRSRRRLRGARPLRRRPRLPRWRRSSGSPSSCPAIRFRS